MTMKNPSDVLLLIPCCSTKDRNGPPPRITSAPLDAEISQQAFDLLDEGQELVAEKYPKRFELASPLSPAMVWYTGNPYKMAGFRDMLDSAFERGTRCLIVSAGYGLLRPDDPIHKYNLKMPETLTIWKRKLPQILADYISRNGVKRVFATMSSNYCKAIVRVEALSHGAELFWYVPRLGRGKGRCPSRDVPEAVGHAVIDLIASDFKPDSRWGKSPVCVVPTTSR